MTKITVLIDNQPHRENPSLEVEHGLSFYIETINEKILIDTGASDRFLHNAGKLGIDIADVDYLILSHAHNDHTGGLACFLQHNNKAKICLSSHINGAGYYSNRRKLMRYISIDYNLVQDNKGRFIFVSDNQQLTPDIRIVSRIPARYSLPQADRTLFAGSAPDSFDHEIAVLIVQGCQTVLLSSCTHMGLLNTLDACAPASPSVFIGGMHLIDSDADNQFETESEYNSIAETIRKLYPDLHIYTGHCTGSSAKCALTRLLPGQFHTFHTGYEWNIP